MVNVTMTANQSSKVEFVQYEDDECREDEIKITPTRINVLSERARLDSGVFSSGRQSSKEIMAGPQTLKVSLEFELIVGAHGLTTENIKRAVEALVGLEDSKEPSKFEMVVRRRKMIERLEEFKLRTTKKYQEMPRSELPFQRPVSQDTPTTTEPDAFVW